MRKLYNEFFYIPKYGKIREKVMLTRVAMTVVIMVVCLAAMGFTAYAYFSHNVTSGSNIIKAANFEAKIKIDNPDGEDPALSEVNGKTYAAQLKAKVMYTFTLEPGGTADTGFCVITADGCNQTYHTQQLGVDKSIPGGCTLQVKFNLCVSEDTTVYILSHWGTSSHYAAYESNGVIGELYITNENVGEGNAVRITIGGTPASVGESSDDEETNEKNTSSDTTTSTETTPTVDKHIVQSGETLTSIANKYGWSVKALQVYNKLSDPNMIVTGQIIKIPPADWEMPEVTTSPATTIPSQTTAPETTAPSETTTTTPETTQPADTTASETTGTSEPTDTTEPSNTSEPSASANTTESAATEPTDTTASPEIQPTEETTGAPTTEASE